MNTGEKYETVAVEERGNSERTLKKVSKKRKKSYNMMYRHYLKFIQLIHINIIINVISISYKRLSQVSVAATRLEVN